MNTKTIAQIVAEETKMILYTITTGNKKSIIVNRSEADSIGPFVYVSATDAQPYVGFNYLDGTLVGGRTMGEGALEVLLKVAKDRGFEVRKGS